MMKSKYLLSILATLLIIWIPISGWAQVSVSLPSDVKGEVGGNAVLPITVGDLTGLNAMSFEFTITYDESIVEITGYDKVGTLSENMSIEANTTVPGQIKVAAAGTAALAGSGILLNLQVEYLAAGSSDLVWTDFMFNEGEPSATTVNGHVIVGAIYVSLPTLAGDVGGSDVFPITVSDLTDKDVMSYEFTITYDESIVEITGYDASGTLSEDMNIVDNTGVTGQIRVAAAGTAALSGEGTLLKFSIEYVGEGSSDLTFTNFMFNEGNPSAELANGKVFVGRIDIILPDTIGNIGKVGLLPIIAEDLTGKGILAYNFTITYDPNVINITGYDKTGTLSEGMNIVDNTGVTGQIRVAAAGTAALEGSGILLNLQVGYLAAGSSDLVWTDFMFNEGEPVANTIDGSVLVNQPPVFENVMPDTAISEGQKLEYTYTATDPDGDELTFGLVDAPEGAVIDGSSGVFTWTPTYEQSGTYDIVAIVTDGIATDTSTTAIVVVETDIISPEIAGVVAISVTALQVRFSEEVDPVTAVNVANYSIDGDIGNPASVEMVKNNIAVLTIAEILPNTDYVLTVNGIKDLTGNMIAENSVAVFRLAQPGELPIDIVSTDFEADMGTWKEPTYSGSTSGILTNSTFVLSDEAVFDGTKSAKMTLLDDPDKSGGWFVRVWNQGRPDVAIDSKLYTYVKASDPDIQVRFVFRDDGADGDNEYLASPWVDITYTEDDWQVIWIDLAKTPLASWVVVGDGIITSTDVISIDCIQLQCQNDVDAVLYFDKLTERPSISPVEVTFEVNMSYQVTLGNFNINSDFVDVAGTFNDWAGSGAMDDADGDTVYSITITDLYPGETVEYKFRINGNWDTSEFPFGGPNRVYVVPDTNSVVSHWYNDKRPPEGIIDSEAIPEVYSLHQNYPNPFNPITTIKYDLPKETHVVIEVYNLMGQRVITLVNEKQNTGYHTVNWDGRDVYGNLVASGTYFYRIVAGNFNQTKKMMFLK